MSQINKQEFDDLKDAVMEIKTAICGNEKMGHVGLVKDMAEMKTWRGNLKLRMSFVAGAFISVWELFKLGIDYLKPHDK